MLSIAHRIAHGMCPVNGIRDLVHWRTGLDWSNEFVWGLGQGGGFAYLRFKVADPPCQVYWGASTARQHEYLANLLGASLDIIENRSFKFAWNKACESLDAGMPLILGPLDMFYLPYYEHIYQQRHIPIHYVLLVGHDKQHAFVLDTGEDDVQTVPLSELQAAWDVNVPAMGKRNRLARIDIPAQLAPVSELIRQSIADQCRTMLHPPVNMVGIPAMEKWAREIANWPAQWGEERAAACLRHAREYLNSPPDISGDHLTAGRDKYIAFLQEAGPLAGLDMSPAIDLLQESMRIIPPLHQTIANNDLEGAAEHIRHIAAAEKEAFTALEHVALAPPPCPPPLRGGGVGVGELN